MIPTSRFSQDFFSQTASSGQLRHLAYNHVVSYPTPANLSYFWTFGSLAGFCLAIQIISGIFLAMHYNAAAALSFGSVEHIMRDVAAGWFMRYLHANGASAFFAVVYLHMLRSLYYRGFSFQQRNVWLSGGLIFVLMMATAFIGYVLPWGQMSFWGATVITNFFSVIPLVGPELVYWIWGGFSVGAPTLSRFYSLHYLLPFLLTALVFVHFFYLHLEGSSNPFSLEQREVNAFYLPLYPYFLVKDLFGLFCFSVIFCYFLFYAPNALGHSDNYIEANSMVTPEHIVPEWYFLPFYAILRSIPNKALGIVAMGLALVYLVHLPLGHRVVLREGSNPWGFLCWDSQSTATSGELHFFLVSFFAASFLVLGFIGACPVEEPYLSMGFLFTILYFLSLEAILIHRYIGSLRRTSPVLPS